MIAKTFSEAAISQLTGIDRRTVKRRLDGIKPVAMNGNGPIFEAPECFQAAFDHLSDRAAGEAVRTWVSAERERKKLLDHLLTDVPEAAIRVALGTLSSLLLDQGVPDPDRMINAVCDQLEALEDTVKAKHEAKLASLRESLRVPRVKEPEPEPPWPDPEN